MLLHKKRIPFKEIIFTGILPSFLKKFIYRLKGYKIGKHVRLGFGSLIVGKNIVIKKNVRIAPLSIIIADEIAIDEGVSFGSFTYIDTLQLKVGKQARIRESVWVGGNKNPDSSLEIGDQCLILQNTILNTTDRIRIGNNTAIGGGSRLFTHSSWLSILDGYPVIQGKIEIGSNVWIPYDTTILANVTIGDHVVITPRSVISQNIPAMSIAGGHPLAIRKNFYRRDLSQEKQEKILNNIFVDFESILSYEGYTVLDTGESYKIYKKENVLYCLIQTDVTLALSAILKINDRYNITILSVNEIDHSLLTRLPKSSVVFIKDKHPVVIRPSEHSALVLTFLSRYGIR